MLWRHSLSGHANIPWSGGKAKKRAAATMTINNQLSTINYLFSSLTNAVAVTDASAVRTRGATSRPEQLDRVHQFRVWQCCHAHLERETGNAA